MAPPPPPGSPPRPAPAGPDPLNPPTQPFHPLQPWPVRSGYHTHRRHQEENARMPSIDQQDLQAALSQLDGTLTVPILDAPATILRDECGIPHIRAKTTADAYRVLGFV